MPNYKPAFLFGSDPKPCTNGEVYATEAEARASAEQRFSVWMMPSDFTTVETEDPVNGTWVFGHGRVTTDSPVAHSAPAQVRLCAE